MGRGHGEASGSERRAAPALRRTLGWADEAADRGEHSEALSWLYTAESVGYELPETYLGKREQWRSILSDSSAREQRPEN